MNWLTISGTAVLLSALMLNATAQHDHDGHDGHVDAQALGTVNFGAGCDDDAAKRFNQALALKHHMMYQQARANFRDLSEQAPNCAMAHWGVAATYFQPLWPERPDEQALKQGRNHIAQAQEAGATDAREQALIDAVGAFFDERHTAYSDRLEAWAQGMADAYEAHPADLDIAALYSLSLLALAMAADSDKRDQLHNRAEAILTEVWEVEDQHPGAIHYAIHATDVDGRAENALPMVEAYSGIAPAVPHALHMPSHIYVRLGDWDQVIDWNRRSADAAREHDVNGAVSFHYIHAIDYMVYGHLQRGEVDQAIAAKNEAMSVDRHQSGFVTAYHAAAMPARIAVEQRDWSAARELSNQEPDYLAWEDYHWPAGMTWYARGLGAVHSGDLQLAREAETKLATLRDQARDSGEERHATYIEVDRKILSGWIQHAEGNDDAAVDALRAAAELESTVEKDPVTPGALLPPKEALGDLLLVLDRPDDALAAYEASEKIWPNRYNTRRGMERANTRLTQR